MASIFSFAKIDERFETRYQWLKQNQDLKIKRFPFARSSWTNLVWIFCFGRADRMHD